MNNFAERVNHYNENLTFKLNLPEGIRMMNPFLENPHALEISSAFYRKFYSDNNERRLILGINPGRFGAGVTGIPFTDTKRLAEKCGIHLNGVHTHEPSSVFIYEAIEAYGGVEKFYSDYYINSPSPLGFVKIAENGKEINYNYYDSRELLATVYPLLIKSIKDHISMGVKTDVAYCLGTGKNYNILYKLNNEFKFFGKLMPLEHPRYIMQYKAKHKTEYIEKYLKALRC
ncbi:MAG: uracil-DNA glycosylase family protein [Bacteroidales bacterium]